MGYIYHSFGTENVELIVVYLQTGLVNTSPTKSGVEFLVHSSP